MVDQDQKGMQQASRETRNLGSRPSSWAARSHARCPRLRARRRSRSARPDASGKAGTNEIIAGTGATGEALRDLQSSMRDVAAEVPPSFGTVGGLAELNTRLGATGSSSRTCPSACSTSPVCTRSTPGTAAVKFGRQMSALEIDVADAGVARQAHVRQPGDGDTVRPAHRLHRRGRPGVRGDGSTSTARSPCFSEFERAGARPEELLGSLNIVLTRPGAGGFTGVEEAFNALLWRIEDASDRLSAVENRRRRLRGAGGRDTARTLAGGASAAVGPRVTSCARARTCTTWVFRR